MAFNADPLLEAMEPPSITVGGVTYPGRLLGTEEMMPFQARFDALVGTDAPIAEVIGLCGDMCDAMEIPKEVVLKLPPSILVAAVQDFLASLWGGGASPQTSGSASPPRAAGNRKARRSKRA